jgi:hypothetical protein
MLGWFRRLWSRDQRLLFSFHDGDRTRWADPIATAAAIEERVPDWAAKCGLIRDDLSTVPAGPMRDDQQRQQKDARKELLAVTRDVFGLAPFTDRGGVKQGLPEAETVALLHRFLAWFFAAAEDARPFSTWPPRGAGCPADSPTAPSAASGSAAG